jgi:light-regulated signal transduction histidine kinase (bacteriophytochrome)
MKNKRIISLLLAGMMLVASVGFVMAEEHITGTIAEKGDVIVLDAADGSYILEGSDMAAEMVGKKVNVTGTIAEEGNARVITVIQIEEATE